MARIAFIGVGRMGQCAHLRNYCAISGCEIVALAELRQRTAAAVARRYNIPRVYADFHELIRAEKPDGLVVSQPFDRHGVLLPEIIPYGIPIFIEKPLASSLEHAARIVSLLEKSGSWLMVGYHKRNDPACRYALDKTRELRASGAIGPLRYIRVTMPPGDWVAGGFLEHIDEKDAVPGLPRETSELDEPTRKAYHAFVNYYIHQINLIRYFLDEPYRVSYADPAGVLFVGHGASGAPCVIEMAPYRATQGWHERVFIAFERGYIDIGLPAPLALNRAGTVDVYLDPGDKTPELHRPHLGCVHAMRRQAMNFLAAIEGREKPACLAAEALEDMRIAREYIRLWKGV